MTRIPLPERIAAAVDFMHEQLRGHAASPAKTAIVLGSGLGGVVAKITDAIAIPYREIPHFAGTAVEGHRGRLLAGLLGDAPVLCFEGRVHGYEGHPPEETTFAVRVIAALDIATVVVTNAAGGIREDLVAGDLVAISDHINLTGVNPAAGLHDGSLGPRFPALRFPGPRFFDMTDAYSPQLRKLAVQAAAAQGWHMAEGVYLGVQGPSFETPAEIKAFRTMGADLVGMSTVHEVIIARQCGLQVLGISCVTNMAAGVLGQPLTHGEVMETGASASGRLGDLLAAVIPQIAA
jgi:purine-nucleoside phosphorylase